MHMKIGDTIYKFDVNRRQYTKPAPGHCWGEQIYEYHFEPHTISGETTRSWLVDEYGGQTRINKDTLLSSRHRGFQWYTEEGKAGHLWLRKHRQELIRRFEQSDYDTMRKIADLLGYTAND